LNPQAPGALGNVLDYSIKVTIKSHQVLASLDAPSPGSSSVGLEDRASATSSTGTYRLIIKDKAYFFQYGYMR
jgi:hypothetical protein